MSPKQNTPNRSIDQESVRTGLSAECLQRAFANSLFYNQAKYYDNATPHDHYMAVAYAVRDRLLQRWINSIKTYTMQRENVKVVCYFSAEFLLGPHLANNLVNLGIYDAARKAIESYGLDFNTLLDQEEEPGLGNGGLGRLAACYMDSLSTLQIPAIGYGIRYEFGIFDQEIRDGWQIELTDKWLQLGNPWEIVRPEAAFEIQFGGHTEHYTNQEGRFCVRWFPDRVVKGIPYDTPIPGYKVDTVNMIRLWKAEAPESFDFQDFNVGDYYGAVDRKVRAENLTKVLYPNDEPVQGKELRLAQQYFFVSCSLQDMIRTHLTFADNLDNFHQHWAAQLNDTHPSIGVAELMRLLVDEQHMDWDKAWGITTQTFAYTNHTLLPEALEKWPIDIFKKLLPRHLEIIYEINRRLLDDVRIKNPEDRGILARLSLIDESGPGAVRMANLACVGSHAINGVAELHTRLLKKKTLRDFFEYMPEKFSNKTNGVTPRRWLLVSNPRLSELISGKIGSSWITDLNELQLLEDYFDDNDFLTQWRNVKLENKRELASSYCIYCGVEVNPESLFDVQVKRMHEYKRQHLNVLHIITLYNRLKQNPELKMTPRTFIFGGKAAPGYRIAKLMIKLINSVAGVINNDPDLAGRLKVVFIPNFNVKTAQKIYPIADLSEQISTAGKEASGTGNMKFAMNGALTIGTLDGANIEIREAVGKENFFLFGLTAKQVDELKGQGYHPRNYYNDNVELKAAIDLIDSGFFAHGGSGLFKPLVDNLLNRDEYMVLADFQSYINCQDEVNQVFLDQDRWTRLSLLNVARMGRFSSDRSIREYCREIWGVKSVPVKMEELIPFGNGTR